jgi:hypothetical protein
MLGYGCINPLLFTSMKIGGITMPSPLAARPISPGPNTTNVSGAELVQYRNINIAAAIVISSATAIGTN